jgi:DNA-binding response OmpR family regulator
MQHREEPTPDSEGRAIILVVERDPHIRELESYFLNEAGFAVDFAADGRRRARASSRAAARHHHH